jgi:hypothetical protein
MSWLRKNMPISYSDSIKKVHLSKRGERDHAEFAMSWPCNCKCANNALPPMAMCPVAVGHSHDASNKQGRSHACMIPHACHMHRLLPTLLASNITRDFSRPLRYDAWCLPCKGISISLPFPIPRYCARSLPQCASLAVLRLSSSLLIYFLSPQVNVFLFAGKHHMHGAPYGWC